MKEIDVKKLSREVFKAMEYVDKEDQDSFFKTVDKIAQIQDGADEQTIVFSFIKSLYHATESLNLGEMRDEISNEH